MKYFNKQTGHLAEELAVRTLKNKGYKILKRNFSNRFGEIDIIAKDGETLVFVEVKAKMGTLFGLPEEMINNNKLKRVQNMALVYLKGKNVDCRIDVIAIVFSGKNQIQRLTHYENVTTFS